MAKKARLATDANGHPIQNAFHPVKTDVLTVGGAADVTPANFLDGYEVVQLYTSANCYVRFHTTVTDVATAADWVLITGVIKEYTIRDAKFISCLQTAGGGFLYVTPVD